MVRIATVGTSSIVTAFLAACRASGRYELYACYSRSIERAREFAAEQGIKNCYDSPEALANDKNVDAVYIASPNSLHYGQSKLLLEAGKHVICEKTITTSKEEFYELSELAKSKGLIYIEAIISRHSKSRNSLHNALRKIGKIKSADIHFCKVSSRYDAFLSGEQVNIFDMSLAAGTLMDLGIYCVWAAIDLFGMPKEISASASLLHTGADGSRNAKFKYNGYYVNLKYSKVSDNALLSVIEGDGGRIEIDLISQYSGIRLIKNDISTEIHGTHEHYESMVGEAENFANYIENFEAYKKNYEAVTSDTDKVLECMDIIKHKANLKYS